MTQKTSGLMISQILDESKRFNTFVRHFTYHFTGHFHIKSQKRNHKSGQKDVNVNPNFKLHYVKLRSFKKALKNS